MPRRSRTKRSTSFSISSPPTTQAFSVSSSPDADFAGYNFWLGKLDEFGGDWRAAEMVKAFVSSIEYRKRFGAP